MTTCLKFCSFLLFSLLLSENSWAQTKLIFHKSHSGTTTDFVWTLRNEITALENSDFGMAPERLVRNAVLDSLIFLSDSVTVMVTSEYCKRVNRHPVTTKKWKAGKDTMVNHFLFTKRLSENYIRTYIHNYYNFENPSDSIVFVFIENQDQQEDTTQYQSIPVASFPDEPGNTTTPSPYLWLSFLFLVSCLSTGLYYFIRQKAGRMQRAATGLS